MTDTAQGRSSSGTAWARAHSGAATYRSLTRTAVIPSSNMRRRMPSRDSSPRAPGNVACGTTREGRPATPSNASAHGPTAIASGPKASSAAQAARRRRESGGRVGGGVGSRSYTPAVIRAHDPERTRRVSTFGPIPASRHCLVQTSDSCWAATARRACGTGERGGMGRIPAHLTSSEEPTGRPCGRNPRTKGLWKPARQVPPRGGVSTPGSLLRRARRWGETQGSAPTRDLSPGRAAREERSQVRRGPGQRRRPRTRPSGTSRCVKPRCS